MSASETNIEKQKTRHRGPLVGFAFALFWAGALFLGLLIWTAYQSDEPTAESPAQVLSD
ncbi:hypothetical protein [Yoonia litorea]|uniref:Uncharacterized protein n=1 Tax=Yoonia litorea TaxID=1123755 RepID=A0A1I6LNI4_9RHOB|nr:hypothetical protein [Yoonia litorea]SFS05077.1 hypothetical protein SAMN05444714_0745 [Yoonia litorea]